MRCDEFLRLWNERLDAASSPNIGNGSSAGRYANRTLDAHVADCADCRQAAIQFMILERGLVAGCVAPKPSPGLESRIVEAWRKERTRSGRWEEIWLAMTEWSWPRWRFDPIAALTIISMIGIAIALSLPPVVHHHPRRVANKGEASGLTSHVTPTLNQALATATEATWLLAQSASRPAASLGREFVASALPSSFPNTTVDTLVPDPSAASSALERIGGQVVEGAKPLSSAARRAFSFLSLPSTEKNPGRRAISPPDKRA